MTLRADIALGWSKGEVESVYSYATRTREMVARKDSATFAGYVLQDEKSGGDIEMAPLHYEWHDLCAENDRMVLWSAIELGKTSQITMGRILWELGNNPALRVAIASATKTPAQKMLMNLAQYIVRSERLHRVFPDLRPTNFRGLPWNRDALTVHREVYSKDPSVQALGLNTDIISSRVDLLVFDDLLNKDNTSTPHRRKEVWSWVEQAMFSRLTEGSRVWFLGNAWYEDDAMHRLAALPRFNSYRFGVYDDEGKLRWPKKWSEERIAEHLADLTPQEGRRQLWAQPIAHGDRKFKPEYIQRALSLGDGWEVVWQVNELPEGFYVVTGVDLASRTHAKADETAFVTVLLHDSGFRQVLNIDGGRWEGPDIVAKIDDLDRRYGGVFVVENVAAQKYILDFGALFTRASLVPFATGKNKADPSWGVESMATELANGRWVFPNNSGKMHKEIGSLVSEMHSYTPGRHVGDRLMAMWFAREFIRKWERAHRPTAAQAKSEFFSAWGKRHGGQVRIIG